ncbi:hypothetical protein EYF80_053167 [Liparis tanakae]|uniref:Uncharacterized protein n=1 Tax=Liparis tanakae TaxID=230148 RepID=A0A4Z2F707_9TELE|nr:hypothetical protein EYF80_053167 [Liparis tanakae]
MICKEETTRRGNEREVQSAVSCAVVKSTYLPIPGLHSPDQDALLHVRLRGFGVQLPVGGDLDVQGQLDVEKVLVLLQVSRHLALQRVHVLLQAAHRVLVTRRLHGEAVLHLPELAFQRLVLEERRQE